MASKEEKVVLGVLAVIFLALLGVLIWILATRSQGDEAERTPDALANAQALLAGCLSASEKHKTDLRSAINEYDGEPNTTTELLRATRQFQCTAQTQIPAQTATPSVGTFDDVSIDEVSARKRPPEMYVFLGMGVLAALVAGIVYFGRQAARSGAVGTAASLAAGAMGSAASLAAGAMGSAAGGMGSAAGAMASAAGAVTERAYTAVAKAPRAAANAASELWQKRQSLEKIKAQHMAKSKQMEDLSKFNGKKRKEVSRRDLDAKGAKTKILEEEITALDKQYTDLQKGLLAFELQYYRFDENFRSEFTRRVDELTNMRSADTLADQILKYAQSVGRAEAAETLVVVAQAAANKARDKASKTAADAARKENELRAKENEASAAARDVQEAKAKAKAADEAKAEAEAKAKAADQAAANAAEKAKAARNNVSNEVSPFFQTKTQENTVKISEAANAKARAEAQAAKTTVSETKREADEAAANEEKAQGKKKAADVAVEQLRVAADWAKKVAEEAKEEAVEPEKAAENAKKAAVDAKTKADRVKTSILGAQPKESNTKAAGQEAGQDRGENPQPPSRNDENVPDLMSFPEEKASFVLFRKQIFGTEPVAPEHAARREMVYGTHFNAILYWPSALALYRKFLESEDEKKSDQEYRALFQEVGSGVYEWRSYDLDQDEINANTVVRAKIYQLVEVPGNGDCFYHAVILAMNKTFPDIDIPNTPTALRKDLVERAPKDLLDAKAPGEYGTVRNRLSTERAWAEDEEIYIFSRVYQVMVTIWISAGSTWMDFDGTEEENQKRSIKLYLE